VRSCPRAFPPPPPAAEPACGSVTCSCSALPWPDLRIPFRTGCYAGGPLTRVRVTECCWPEVLLATSWSHSPDGLTWTFQLRHGVYFHTGRPMTAEAARAAILRTKTLGAGASYVWGAVRSISTPGLYTLVFHLSPASPLALEA
jgi:hypothetical protein